MRLLASFDRYPDSVSLTLEPVTADSREFELYLTLHLQPQKRSLLDGYLLWELKGGVFSVTAERCSIAPISYHTDEVVSVWAATPAGYRWRLSFTAGRGGAIERVKLGTIEVKEEPYHLTGRFSVTPSDVSIFETAGLWRPDISPNQHGILERKLSFFLFDTSFDPFLSQVSLGSTGVELERVFLETPREISTELQRLQADIARISALESDNFLRLARSVELDPLTDLAGANLLAAELSGVSLGGASLHHVNLRGANLTDADLSEAIATRASFKGADLSGALLANADLSYADFYRSSLALANLIGANLEGANLIEANLSQANLSGAKVTGASFGDNTGMTDELRENLLDRGAVFF
jgi:uncharacterized protein YjbI with pentapeptide repeats